MEQVQQNHKHKFVLATLAKLERKSEGAIAIKKEGRVGVVGGSL
jgi:hypothetical protein